MLVLRLGLCFICEISEELNMRRNKRPDGLSLSFESKVIFQSRDKTFIKRGFKIFHILHDHLIVVLNYVLLTLTSD